MQGNLKGSAMGRLIIFKEVQSKLTQPLIAIFYKNYLCSVMFLLQLFIFLFRYFEKHQAHPYQVKLMLICESRKWFDLRGYSPWARLLYLNKCPRPMLKAGKITAI